MDKPKEGDVRIRTTLRGSKVHEKYTDRMWVWHNADGPAIILPSGSKGYALEGIVYREHEFYKTTKLGKILYG